jgi:hypothetical protein
MQAPIVSDNRWRTGDKVRMTLSPIEQMWQLHGAKLGKVCGSCANLIRGKPETKCKCDECPFTNAYIFHGHDTQRTVRSGQSISGRIDTGGLTMAEPLVNQAITLTSGTIATLTGLFRYDDIEKVQDEFVEFCEETSIRFTTWQQAWIAYKLIKGSK